MSGPLNQWEAFICTCRERVGLRAWTVMQAIFSTFNVAISQHNKIKHPRTFYNHLCCRNVYGSYVCYFVILLHLNFYHSRLLKFGARVKDNTVAYHFYCRLLWSNMWLSLPFGHTRQLKCVLFVRIYWRPGYTFTLTGVVFSNQTEHSLHYTSRGFSGK